MNFQGAIIDEPPPNNDKSKEGSLNKSDSNFLQEALLVEKEETSLASTDIAEKVVH